MTSSPPNSVTEKHLGRTHAQPLRRCTTKNHLEAKDVEAEDVDDVAAWPLAEADADALGDVQGREGPEADQALVSQAAEDVEAEDVDDVAAWPLAEADADALGDVEGREGVSQAAEDGVLLEADVVAEPPRDVDDDVAWRLSPRLTRTCSGTSKAAKGRRPIECSWRRPPRTRSSSKRMSLANRGATSTTTWLGGSRQG